MRTLAIALLVLALPTAAEAGFKSEAMPSAPRHGPISGGDAEYRRGPGSTRVSVARPPARAETSLADGYYRRQLARASDAIDRRRERGELTRGEARQLRRELGRIRSAARWYGRDGYSASELGALELRASELGNRAATGHTS